MVTFPTPFNEAITSAEMTLSRTCMVGWEPDDYGEKRVDGE